MQWESPNSFNGKMEVTGVGEEGREKAVTDWAFPHWAAMEGAQGLPTGRQLDVSLMGSTGRESQT